MKTDYNVFSDTVDKNGNVTKKIQKMKMSELTTAESYWDADLSGINTKSSNIKFAYYKMDNDYRPADARTDIPCLCNKLKYYKNGVTPVVESIWHTQVIAVSYTHLDVYKRQVSRKASVIPTRHSLNRMRPRQSTMMPWRVWLSRSCRRSVAR